MGVTLYTTRVVLSALGASDYGLYNVVGGFVSMLAFVNSSLTNATQRFITYELGKNDNDKIKLVFQNSLTMHLSLMVIVVIVAETVGLWFVSEKLSIPESRNTVAIIVYQISILTTCVSIIQVPFMSVLIAHERMKIYAYIGIYEAVMKLIVAYCIDNSAYDKLVLYAFLLLLVGVTTFGILIVYSKLHFEIISFKLAFSRSILKKMTNVSGWTLIGMVASTLNLHGINLLINLFFGVVVNAARGIAYQVNAAINGFVSNFLMAAKPQIIKLYAENKIEEMTNLTLNVCRYSAYLLLFFMIPVYFEIEYVLTLWLGDYPYYTPYFLRIVLLQSLIVSMSQPVIIVTLASGRLKMPNLTGGLILLLPFPISYILFKMGCPLLIVLLLNIIPYVFEGFTDSYYAQKYTGFSQRRFYKEVYFPVFKLAIPMYLLPFVFVLLFPEDNMVRLILIIILSTFNSSLLIYNFGIDKHTRQVIKHFVYNKFAKNKI
jgi:O-antigen/teichoic acid export membrane protein